MSIGDTLAEARRQAGLTVGQVSQQTRVRESIVRAIEQDDFSPCGGDFYARGHIRSIAEVVGADPAQLIREYDEGHPQGSMRASQIFEPATPIKIRDPRNLHLGRVLAVAVLAVAGFGAYRVLADNHSPKSAANATATVQPAATPAASTPKVTATPTVSPSTPAPKPTEAVVTLTANSDCWVGFDNPTTGQQTSQVTVYAGQTITWREKQPVAMVIGNPPGVTLTVNGKVETMKAGQVARLQINPTSNNPVTIG